MTVKTALWLLPLGFVLHDGEELLTMVGWIARHRPELERWSSENPLVRRLVESVPSTPTEVLVTMALELALLIAGTAIAARDVRKGIRLYAYSAMLGVFVLHAGTHALQALIFGGYTPGIVTAMTVIPVVAVVSYRALVRSDLLSLKAAVTTAMIGVVVFVPLFALFVHLAQRIDEAL